MTGEPLALYVHWPFCVTKCPYCDFNSHVRATVDDAAWCAALLADLTYEAEKLPDRRLASIFFGGGTPSLMPPATVAAIIAAATSHPAACSQRAFSSGLVTRLAEWYDLTIMVFSTSPIASKSL